MKISVFLVGLLGLCRGDESVESKPSDVVVLTNANFEHDTQVTSGATTGDWFVKFYAPWCGHCKALAPKWEEVAHELKGKADEGVSINVAKVDVTTNSALGKRFDIKGFPSLIFFSKGVMYKYPAGKEWPREKDALLNFALGAYEDAVEGELTPPPPNLGDELKKLFAQLVESVSLVPGPWPLSHRNMYTNQTYSLHKNLSKYHSKSRDFINISDEVLRSEPRRCRGERVGLPRCWLWHGRCGGVWFLDYYAHDLGA